MIKVPQATIDWLLAPKNAPVRLLTLQGVVGRLPDDPDVVSARSNVMSAPWIRTLMRTQDPAGWWVNPKNCYQPRGVGTVWHLQLLAELGADGDDPRMSAACDRFLDMHAMPDGGFACGVRAGRYSEECVTGHMLHALVAFGRGAEPAARAARDWLLTRQLADGGWNCRPHQSHSSFVSTLGATKALARLPGRSSRAAVARAVEFVMRHRVFYSHTTGKPVSKFWPPPLLFPEHYAYDLLHPLRTLVVAGAKHDPRLDAALDLLEGRADGRGRWNTDGYHGAIEVEKPGRAGKWVTASALTVLRHFGRTIH